MDWLAFSDLCHHVTVTRKLPLHAAALSGLHLGHVQLIFTLPQEYGSFSKPLLYIHWFKPLHIPIPDLEMYNVSFAS